MTTQHILWSDSANCSLIINLLSYLHYSVQWSQLTTYIVSLLCEVSKIFQQNLISSHKSEHFTSHQEQQRCLFYSRIYLTRYRMTQWLYWNAIENVSSFWKLMKEHANKTTDKR